MKIIPYSVLAATLFGGTLGGRSATSAPGRTVCGASSLLPQEGEKPKAATVARASAWAEDSEQFPAGTTIYAELVKPIDVRKSKPGDPIVARATLPVLLRGKIAVANDAKIIGRVTEAVVLSGADGHSRLGILFDRVTLKDGRKAHIALTVQAIGRRPLIGSGEGESQDDDGALRPPRLHPATTPGTHMPANQMPPEPSGRELPGSGVSTLTPTLDAGNHGTVGMPDVKLIESNDAARGSVIESVKRNVKLQSETELVLRVIAEPTD